MFGDFEKCSILFQSKAEEDFNLKKTFSILRFEI